MSARYTTTFLRDLAQFLSAEEAAETRQRVIELDPKWLPVVIMVRPIDGESLDTKDDVRKWLNGQIQLGFLEVYDEIFIEFRHGARNIGIADQEFGRSCVGNLRGDSKDSTGHRQLGSDEERDIHSEGLDCGTSGWDIRHGRLVASAGQPERCSQGEICRAWSQSAETPAPNLGEYRSGIAVSRAPPQLKWDGYACRRSIFICNKNTGKGMLAFVLGC